MKQKKIETLLYSAAGVAVMFLIVVAVNFITSAFKKRLDMTKDDLYTLSVGTKAILKKLDAPVELRFYRSQGGGRMPSQFATHARHIEDLLYEFKQNGHGNIEVKPFDPQPDSDDEDLARLDGIEPQMLPTGEHLYLGLAVSLDPQKVALPFLSPEREKLLEYDIARAISQVLSTNKPVVGVMTPLPVFGSQMPPQMAMRMGQQGQEPWVFLSELKRDFEVRQVQMDTEKIDDDIKVLFVVHPKDIKDTAQYAIDQFVMRGGKLIACLDATSLADQNKSNPMMPMPGGPSNLDKLLKAWGITFENSKVVADMNFARQLRGPNGQPMTVPTYLFVTAAGIAKDDVVASQIDELLMPLAGCFTGTPAAGLKESVLLKTTTESQLVDGMMASMAPQKIADDFKSEGKSQKLAIRLSGKFKSAFPDGKPAAAPDDKDKKDEKKDEPKPGDSLKETRADNVVTLIGDTDFLSDQFSVQVQNFFGQKIIQPRNGNLNFTQSLVEQMAGDQNLIGTRSRATQNRPFTKVIEMQAAAQKDFQDVIKKLEEKQQEAQRKVNELQTKKDASQRFNMSPEQQAEIKKFRAEQAAANKELKEARKKLRRGIESLEFWTKVINIAAMPVIVAVAGIALGLARKQRTKAT